MTATLDPIEASDQISSDYRRYLRSLVPVRDAALAAALDEEIAHAPLLTKGPLLEASPAYARGASLNQLVGEGVLPTSFRMFDSPALPMDRALYVHQEAATRKARAGRNLVVSTGTGSGKTESFLIPILASLADELAAGPLNPGVRALILYPMNALANDQMKRLRRVLAATPQVTFGRYIGDTPHDPTKAEQTFATLNPGEPRLPNELLSRQEMQATPPHLLLTNYAMLEYLLLRPEDMVLFDRPDKWRFIVVDEAHVYDGARGSEFAMLLRRLRQRVNAPRLQGIATSATVGADSQPASVTAFAHNLFGLPFEWSDLNPGAQDLVSATRIDAPSGTWGPLTPAQYLLLSSADDLPSAAAAQPGIPSGTLHDAFAVEKVMANVRQRLAAGARTVDDLCRFLGADWTPAAVANVVTVGGALTDSTGVPLLSARYHVWVRATEGVFGCLDPHHPHVQLSRTDTCPECAKPAYELGACSRCGTAYAVGSQRDQDGIPHLHARIKDADRPTWLALSGDAGNEDEDENAFEEGAAEVSDAIEICVDCGALAPQGTSSCPCCQSTSMRAARLVEGHARSLRGCVVCGSRTRGQVRLLDSGADASAAVLSTSLYQNLPPDPGPAGDHPGEGRKLLAFSDSRQGAAFFAPYLDSSYRRLFERRLLLLGMQEAIRAEGGPARTDDVIADVVRIAGKAEIFERRATRRDKEGQAGLWLSRELVAMDERQSLEGLGMVSFELDEADAIGVLPIWASLNISPNDAANLVGELLRSIRRNGAVAFPDGVDPADEAFDPRRGPIYVRQDHAQPRVLSWMPTKGTNRRLDYLTRVLSRAGSSTPPSEVLSGIWRALTSGQQGWLMASNPGRLGTVYQVNHEWLRVNIHGPGDVIYRCGTCGSLTTVSVLGACPSFRCTGTLTPAELPAEADDRNHYRRIYQSLRPLPMQVREHTAQWRAKDAEDIQNQFIRGEVNALSCSTTFELGVDVGELQAVLLRNVPPATANYVQRAGRAGRRTASAALVLTLAQRRSHDLSYFAEPQRMIDGVVRPPVIPLGNDRIDRRHAHSVALAAFFRYAFSNSGHRWRKAGEFFRPSPGQPNPITLLEQYLTPVPADVHSALIDILPPSVQEEINLADGTWVRELLEHMRTVATEVDQEISYFDSAREQASQDKKYRLAEQFQRIVNTLEGRDLLGFLGSRNILPKYGFPTDVVDLRTATSANRVGLQLDLSRDLSTAIYEYAPGSQIVAGGLLWTSAGVYRLPDRELVNGTYAECSNCHSFEASHDDLDGLCPHCGSARHKVKYAIPEFGFIAEREPSQPGSSPPIRSWHGDTYYVNSGEPVAQSSDTHGRPWNLTASQRATMMAVSTGLTGNGFLICEWCGGD